MDEKPYLSAVAVERAVDVLFLLGHRGDASVSEIAKALSAGTSAVQRIVNALKNKGLIQQDRHSKRYALAWGVLSLAGSLNKQADLRGLALPYLTSLRNYSGETVTLNVRSGFERVCIDQVEGPQEIRWVADIGRVLPLYAGGTGKVILAYFPTDELEQYLDTVERTKMTPHTVTDRAELVVELEQIRRQGYVLANQDRILGVSGISAPIFDGSQEAIGAITIAGPSDRCTADRRTSWSQPLLSATREISTLLGHRHEPPSQVSA